MFPWRDFRQSRFRRQLLPVFFLGGAEPFWGDVKLDVEAKRDSVLQRSRPPFPASSCGFFVTFWFFVGSKTTAPQNASLTSTRGSEALPPANMGCTDPGRKTTFLLERAFLHEPMLVGGRVSAQKGLFFPPP